MAKKPKAATFIKDPLWYKDAVIYQVHVKSYFDSNNDGIGDFPGLIAKLDYIADLGVNTIWLLPFYPSPRRDDGYDIAEYRGVHSDYGTMADAKRFIAEAHKRGLRVITELVINHTSDQHPWFQRARKAKPGSAARDFYVWSDDDQKYDGTRIIFLDTEKSNWTWDPVAGQYFWHRFYSHQPDLNFDNPQVMKAVLSVMRYWLDMGIDGLRLDAIPYLIERDGTNNENLPETHDVLKQIRAEIDANYPDRMLLAEANQWPEDTQLYFGDKKGDDGDECHMAFHFPLMPRMYMALAQEDRFPITDILRQTPEIPANCQWAIFLRNHDELTLEMVTDKERDYLWNYYAADRRARINLGIRRRLAPLMERDRRRIELLNSLLLSMPGTPTLYYGDEIGMGDNIYLGDRDGVRTPMQWSIDRNGGFSRADPASLVLPPIMDPQYGYQSVNVETQTQDPHSLLNWTRRMLAVRKQSKAFGRGSLKMLSPSNRRILAYTREYAGADGKNEIILCVANVSRSAQAAELDLSAFAGMVPVEMLGGNAFPPIGQLNFLLTLAPYGFYWFVLAAENQMPSWHVEPAQSIPDFTTLVLKKRMEELLEAPCRTTLEQNALPAWLPKRRWFASKDTAIDSVHIAYGVRFGDPQHPVLLSEIEVTSAGQVSRYQLPFGFLGEDQFTSALPQQLALARVRRVRQVGLVTDAFSLDTYIRGVIQGLQAKTVLDSTDGEIRFEPTAQLAKLELNDESEVRYLAAEQSNSSVVVGGSLVLKLIRKVSAGVHPELEMGAYLTEAGYEHISPLLGSVIRHDADGQDNLLMIAQGYLSNQGDAWGWTQNNLERAIRDELAEAMSEQEQHYNALGELADFAGLLGQRLGEMHLVLAAPTTNKAFKPEVTTLKDSQGWARHVGAQIDHALQLLKQHQTKLNPADQALVSALLEQKKAIASHVQDLAKATVGGLRIRVHGDLHLGQVLVVKGDAYLIDFEGEPARPLPERRGKHSPYKDVSGVLRSFDYAAAMAVNVQGVDQSPEANASRQRVADRYLHEARQAFIQAYHAATTTLAHDWQDAKGQDAALALFSLEKAAYEVAYEAENRPSWLPVPLQGLHGLLSGLKPISKTARGGETS
ncbi:maltose alpha-D-glucosyltransferase [Pseudomonas sp. NPDC087814]|jgi:maltose alpha-D-glucosyltransferase/alpha-amylase|uniref:maltose alpha-D-glucosyltransferase n=1 Tax=unclassified Pseudomonas TaxID=196821 RepID=UPI000272C9D9|nr:MULTISPECIES: maltose alpha-D-glucosyltransferase [unclassified Pseudomonas]AUO23140.1 maltose alpha-D-glucosyltransferase [Pseudomonas sp. NC02]EJF70928.1 putative trehalose synthase protein [Pseudomonas sp. Ag1]NWB40818.1 maltose alpha-D-glucosyltransferase [Pseudomonas sp. E6002]NWB61063.1 maltose alpha-D-glucosyltransferase [Pseudomonas sp. F1002]NWB68137.1 maltose alpha-D-glucosyltransferase [Pseudomonas sp. I8001]